jgi:hypothetical protein
LARQLSTSAHADYHMSNSIKFGSKSIKTGSNSGQKAIKNERISSCPS